MRYLMLLALILSSIPAYAEVFVSGNGVVVNGDRRSDNQNNQPFRYQDSNGRTIEIYNGNSNNGQAYMIRDGKVAPLADGEYKLPSGKKVNIKNGRMDAQFGNGNLNNNIKIIPRN